jgi:hypothetical protein
MSVEWYLVHDTLIHSPGLSEYMGITLVCGQLVCQHNSPGVCGPRIAILKSMSRSTHSQLKPL